MVLPIYGFASPGTYIGSLEVAVSNVPEPSTFLLLGSGILGLAMTRFRKGAGWGKHSRPDIK